MKARRLIVIEGEQEAGFALAQQLLAKFPLDSVLQGTEPVKRVLGKEFLAVIYNTFEGFDPDQLGALGGTVIAGGALILITPRLQDWPDFADPFNDRIANWPYEGQQLSGYFIERFVNKLRQYAFVEILSADAQHTPLTPAQAINKANDFITADQEKVLQQLKHNIQQEASAPIVIEADRGRGKSAVLGMLASECISQGMEKILVTAPSRKTADVIFRHASEQEQLVFLPPDYICQQQPQADLLLVDEAAAIPSALLHHMLRHYPRIIFSTTVHGYEGTGRGFALRFQKQLVQFAPNWSKLTLKQPIRYAEKDPLEVFLFDALLMNAKPVANVTLQDFDRVDCVYETLTSEALLDNEVLLREIFGLLVLAHYQTRPTDLRHLLDGKNISIDCVRWQDHVIAVALCVKEGGFDQQLAHDIHYGMRRPRGHLVPQSLAVHAGIANAPSLITERIMRIVVHPLLQRQGIASGLLGHIQKHSKADYLSSSFGATADLLSFWRTLGFESVRIGLNRDKSSGSHSVIVIKPLNDSGKALYDNARLQFERYLPVLLEHDLVDLETEIIQSLECQLQNQSQKNPHSRQLGEQDMSDIQSFAYGQRGYESCMVALKKLVDLALEQQQIRLQIGQQLTSIQQQLLDQRVLQHKSWQQVVQSLNLTGRKQALKEMRVAIQGLVEMML